MGADEVIEIGQVRSVMVEYESHLGACSWVLPVPYAGPMFSRVQG